MQSEGEGPMVYRRATTFWKPSEGCWVWEKNSLTVHTGQTSTRLDEHAHRNILRIRKSKDQHFNSALNLLLGINILVSLLHNRLGCLKD